ncbi:DEAD/DEAH box helicase [Denitratimonas tolerans]|uniref:ATP-dependent RNA helicase DeaD n=1 Tax=Denitratimonas tolerans TaxID=1338420 RepID=A0AAW9R3V3_9GAMM
MTDLSLSAAGFAALSLSAPLLQALSDVGYESPSPIQAATIPPLLEGRDVVGQAQTGTGKTAAFALPILNRIDTTLPFPQALVLTPTRELAIQVAEAFQTYAAHLKGFQVLPIYGGQGYGAQLHGLKRGAHVLVATPGRLIDHLERGTVNLSHLRALVLDEADEMLRMGFIDDVESILQKTPPERQTALFSATMPPQIRRIAQTYLRDPVDVAIEAKTRTATNIRQRYWLVGGMQKLDAITRLLEVEDYDGMIVFSRTKQGTEELADRLQARGLAAAAINGDIPQPLRERAVQKLKDGQLDILVATDVAARGLDVDRISHVVNYDIPYDVESYVHRIGRTGRAGRSGEAILFVTPRERGMLRAIERATRQPIEPMAMPTSHQVNDQRMVRFKQRIDEVLEGDAAELDLFRTLIAEYEREHEASLLDVAAALAKLTQGDVPLLMPPDPEPAARKPRPEHDRDNPRHPRERHERPDRRDRHERDDRPELPQPPRVRHETDFETYRIAVGHVHHVKPGNIVGAIANEAGLESRHIGRIDIREDHSFVDLPPGMPSETLAHLQNVWVAGQRLRIQRHEGELPPAPRIQRGGGRFSEGFSERPRSRDRDGAPPRAPRGPHAESAGDGRPTRRTPGYTPGADRSDRPRPPGRFDGPGKGGSKPPFRKK